MIRLGFADILHGMLSNERPSRPSRSESITLDQNICRDIGDMDLPIDSW